MLLFSNNMLTLKKFTKIRDDAMIRISEKPTRMYANGLIHQKTIVQTVAFEFFLF